MVNKTVYFNCDIGPNGRRTTSNGGIDIVKYDNGQTDLFIRGPQGGLRHVVMLSCQDAQSLGQELVSLFP